MKNKIILILVFISMSIGGYAQSPTKLSLPSLFANHMVLQQNTIAKIWGWAQPGSSVRLIGSWNSKDTVKVKVDSMGKWLADIKTTKAGGPYSLELLSGPNKLLLKDVMLGEVWLCSGQSNMEWCIRNGVENQKEEIDNAKNYDIRYFSLTKKGSDNLQDDCDAEWEICSPIVMAKRSAIAYFFASKLQKDLQVPVGIIVSAWGGTRAETWMPKSVVEENEVLKKVSDNAVRSQAKPWWPIRPGICYNAMINPLIPLKMAGVLWYQGEANTWEPETYCLLMEKLIESWRKNFGQNLPFYIAQIAPFNYAHFDLPKDGPALLREAQQNIVEKVSATALVGTNDVGDFKNVHPIKKRQVGERFANIALNEVYNLSMGEVYNAIIDKYEIVKNKVRLTCSHVGTGLEMRGKEPIGMTIAGKDGIFVPANVKIKKNIIEVFSSEVKNPVAVRYCFDDGSIGNIFNSEGLPLLPYRSDK